MFQKKRAIRSAVADLHILWSSALMQHVVTSHGVTTSLSATTLTLRALLRLFLGVGVGGSASGVANTEPFIGDLLSGRAFDNGCTCHQSTEGVFNDLVGRCTECHCEAPRLKAQFEFITALLNIGKKLSQLPTKEARSKERKCLCSNRQVL